jgi:hypothetical protein
MATARPRVGEKPPDVTMPTVLPAIDDLRALARDRFALGQEADALARRALGDLLLDDGGAGEAALHPPLLADAPKQHRLDRRGGLSMSWP